MYPRFYADHTVLADNRIVTLALPLFQAKIQFPVVWISLFIQFPLNLWFLVPPRDSKRQRLQGWQRWQRRLIKVNKTLLITPCLLSCVHTWSRNILFLKFRTGLLPKIHWTRLTINRIMWDRVDSPVDYLTKVVIFDCVGSGESVSRSLHRASNESWWSQSRVKLR